MSILHISIFIQIEECILYRGRANPLKFRVKNVFGVEVSIHSTLADRPLAPKNVGKNAVLIWRRLQATNIDECSWLFNIQCTKVWQVTWWLVDRSHIPELYYTSGTSIWLALWLVSFSKSESEDSVWLSGTGERYVQLLSVSHGGRSSVTNVVWGSWQVIRYVNDCE